MPWFRGGFTLVEAIISAMILSIAVVAALQAAAASNVAQYKLAERATARHLADALMDEIMSKLYIDPGPSPVFGPEAGEATTPASRVNFNDVDDYNGWSENPPQDPSGAAIAGMTGWKRTVAVAWVNNTTPTSISLTDSGSKRITVNVYHNSVLILTRVCVRTNVP